MIYSPNAQILPSQILSRQINRTMQNVPIQIVTNLEFPAGRQMNKQLLGLNVSLQLDTLHLNYHLADR